MSISNFRKNVHCVAAVFVITTFFFLSTLWILNKNKEKYYFDRGERIRFLVDELTTTPERQQKALDEIVKDGSGAFVYLIKHLDDDRNLAGKDAMFLNVHPNAFEKYFHAGGDEVGETLLRYLCWKTMACSVHFRTSDKQLTTLQRRKIEDYVKENFINPEMYEN